MSCSASPILQAIWSLCPHDDYVDGCDPCLFRLWSLKEYLAGIRAT